NFQAAASGMIRAVTESTAARVALESDVIPKLQCVGFITRAANLVDEALDPRFLSGAAQRPFHVATICCVVFAICFIVVAPAPALTAGLLPESTEEVVSLAAEPTTAEKVVEETELIAVNRPTSTGRHHHRRTS